MSIPSGKSHRRLQSSARCALKGSAHPVDPNSGAGQLYTYAQIVAAYGGGVVRYIDSVENYNGQAVSVSGVTAGNYANVFSVPDALNAALQMTGVSGPASLTFMAVHGINFQSGDTPPITGLFPNFFLPGTDPGLSGLFTGASMHAISSTISSNGAVCMLTCGLGGTPQFASAIASGLPNGAVLFAPVVPAIIQSNTIIVENGGKTTNTVTISNVVGAPNTSLAGQTAIFRKFP